MPSPARPSFVDRHYAVLAFAVLALAAFNLTFRLGSEVVTEWDESLYAISAWEMAQGGHWVATTFGGALDYYNTKPPLNVWLIALSFRAFGVSLLSLRIASALFAWLTVTVLQVWLRRTAGKTVAIASSLVLATCFPFLYTHAGRSGNTDALFALLMLLTIVTCWVGQTHPWRRAWLGPILAAAFLLKGMGVLMPLAAVAAFEVRRAVLAPKWRWPPIVVACLSAVLPVAGWMWARWQIDRWEFVGRLFTYDFVQGSLRPLEGHEGAPWFYLKVLLRQEYAWLAVVVFAVVVCPIAWPRLRSAAFFWRGNHGWRMAVGTWASVTLLIPTVMGTKLPWYLNPFYPVFSVGVGWLLVRAVSRLRAERTGRWRALALACSFGVALVAAESRLVWYSFHNRDLARSSQGVLLDVRAQLAGHQVFRLAWENGDVFVIRAFGHAEAREITSLEAFFRDSEPGDYFFSAMAVPETDLVLTHSDGRHWLYQRDREE